MGKFGHAAQTIPRLSVVWIAVNKHLHRLPGSWNDLKIIPCRPTVYLFQFILSRV